MVAAEVKNCGGAASVASCDVEDWLWFPGWFRDVVDKKGGSGQRSKDHNPNNPWDWYIYLHLP